MRQTIRTALLLWVIALVCIVPMHLPVASAAKHAPVVWVPGPLPAPMVTVIDVEVLEPPRTGGIDLLWWMRRR